MQEYENSNAVDLYPIQKRFFFSKMDERMKQNGLRGKWAGVRLKAVFTPLKIGLMEINRAPVAQLVEHRAAMREVVSSTPAGPTLRVFK